MKKIVKNIFLILLALGAGYIVKDCCGIFYVRMTHLSKEDLEWIASGRNYPAMTFISDSGKFADLRVDDVEIRNSRNPFFFNESGHDIYEACASYDFNIYQDSLMYKGFFLIKRPIGKNKLAYRSCVDSFFAPFDSVISPCRVVLKDRVLENCIVIDYRNGEYFSQYHSNGIPVIDKFIVSKEYGLVYYRFKTGEQFFRRF